MKNKLLLILILFTSIAKAQVADSALCSKIEYKFDKFSGEKTYSTPGLSKNSYGRLGLSNIVFIKTIQKSISRYYLSLRTIGITPLGNEYGVSLILKNGKKLKKPTAIVSTTVNSDGDYERSSFITLTQTDLIILRKSPITDFQLYIDEDKVVNPDDYIVWLRCLTVKK